LWGRDWIFRYYSNEFHVSCGIAGAAVLRASLLTISIWMVRTFLVCVLERDEHCARKGCRCAGCPSIDPPSGTAEDPPINEIWIVCHSLYWLRGVALQKLDILRSVCSNHVLHTDHMSGSHTSAYTTYGSPQGMNDVIMLGLTMEQRSCRMWRTVIWCTSTVTSYECFTCLSVYQSCPITCYEGIWQEGGGGGGLAPVILKCGIIWGWVVSLMSPSL